MSISDSSTMKAILEFLLRNLKKLGIAKCSDANALLGLGKIKVGWLSTLAFKQEKFYTTSSGANHYLYYLVLEKVHVIGNAGYFFEKSNFKACIFVEEMNDLLGFLHKNLSD